jgi:Putative transposase, YhgA-like
MATPHDRIFKGLLRAFLTDFLSLVAPDWVPRLDLARAVFLDKELFSYRPGNRRRELDLLARVPSREGGGSFLLIHVEVEARARREMARRLRGYRAQIQARHDETVLSIVVFLRRGRPGVRIETLAENLAGPGLGSFHYFAFGVAGCSAAEYLERPEPLSWALAALMDPGAWSRAELKAACLRRIAKLDPAGEESYLLVNCVEMYLQLTPEEDLELSSLWRRERTEVRAMAMTWMEKLEFKGRVEGLEEGKKEGRREGLKEGRREGRKEGLRQGAQGVLLDLLGKRFGPLPEGVRQRVEEIASTSRLRRLAQRALSARSLEEMGLQ